jgi:uncharacterized UPF0160 family protein
MSKLTVVTHDGNFHADDVFSIAALKSVLPAFDLIRSRNKTEIANGDIVIDVGGEYDADTGRFDHHQRGGAGQRENGIPFSSFGLIWQKYGLAICKGSQEVADALDRNLVSTIDAIDCGHVQGVSTGVSLSHTISLFNPTWEEAGDFDGSFDEAVTFAARVLARSIASVEGGVNAKSIVAKAIEDAQDPRLIVLQQYTPWKTTVHKLSEEALFVVYPSLSGKWMIQTVPVELGSFEDRKSLPKPWSGLSDDEFKAVTGIDDAMFCHNGLFIAGAGSFDSIMQMSQLALAD